VSRPGFASLVPRVLWSLVGGLCLLGVGATPLLAQAQEAARAVPEAARTAAQDWLDQIDDRDFADGWEDAAPAFRARIDEDDWTERAGRLADSLGVPSARVPLTARVRDSLRAAPAGPVVVLSYRATFADGPCKEELLLVRADEEWRVAGYQVTALPAAASRSVP
jgi:hypothetical protein